MDLYVALGVVDARTDASMGRTLGADETEPIAERPRNVFRRILLGVFEPDVIDELEQVAWEVASKVHGVQHVSTCQEGTSAIFVVMAQQMLLTQQLLKAEDDDV